jgi:PKD repeat protein
MSTDNTIQQKNRVRTHVHWLAFTIALIFIFVLPVQAALNPDFTGTPRSGFSPVVVQFTDTSTGFVEPVTYLWDFGDGNTSTKQNPQYTYDLPGTYIVKLDITNASGDQATVTQKDYITVEPPVIPDPLIPDFTGTPHSGISPLTVQFTDTSTGPVDQWGWDFGNGNTSTKQNPQYTYDLPGTYSVKLTISNASGEQASITKKDYITVESPIIADPLTPDFTATPVSGPAPLVVRFTDTSTGPVDLWEWDFGDGNTSSKQNPQYTYDLPGTYPVKLTISNASGEQASITKKDYITVNSAPSTSELIPNFTGTPRFGVSPLAVQFTDTTTGFVEPVTYLWDFGDGNTSSTQNPKYTFEQPGLYSVTLTIGQVSGTLASISHKDYITVSPAPVPGEVIPNFDALPRSGISPLTVQFNDTSKGFIEPVTYLWDFGDGNTSSTQNPRYTFHEPGTYTIKLDISNANGEQATITQKDYITVNPAPVSSELIPDFNATPRFGVSPVIVRFNDRSTGFTEPVTYLWDFGDGNTSSQQNPLHTYTEPGSYSIKLDISQGSGALATISKNNYITITAIPLVLPYADFFGIPTSGSAPLTVAFTDLSTNTPISWNWSFGDDSPENATEQNPVHTFSAAGNYTVSILASNANGSDIQTREEYIKVRPAAVPHVLPVADFSGKPTSGDAPLTVAFADLSTNSPTSWKWLFGDDSIENATEQDPVHTYSNPGNYTVSLNATNADGSDTQTRTEYITVNPAAAPHTQPVTTPPIADFSSKPTNGVAPLTVSFKDLSANVPTSWLWSFGDDSVENATEQNPIHTYTNPGNYTVSLNATNVDGSDTQTRTEYIKVAPPETPRALPVGAAPAADFFGIPTSGDTPLTVTFSDLSTNTPTSWNWSFSDDSRENATEQNPIHTFTNPGNYTVSLNAMNADGNDTQTRTEYIKANPATVPLTPPVADFSGEPIRGIAPLTVTFTDSSANNPISWNWSFGDESLENATEQNPVHTYANPGNYTVTLNATNPDGNDTKVWSDYIIVSLVPLEPLIPEPLIPNFTGTPTSGPAPLTVQFNDTSTGPHNQWEWDFGDGNVSSEQNPLYTYNEPGSYSVLLNISQAGGNSGSTTQEYYITVVTPLIPVPLNVTPLIPNFIGTPASGPAPLTVKFNDTSTGPHDQWAWNFGDGNTSLEQNPVYTYNQPGSYSVLLNVSQTDGDSVSRTQEDYIKVLVTPSAPPIAEFTGVPASGFAPLTVTFTDVSTNTPTSWNWSFGDDSVENASEQNPVHTYVNPGTYTVSLNATNAAGLNSTTKTSYLNVTAALTAPFADFSGTPTSGESPLTVQFNDVSTGFVNPVTYFWDFGDGNTSTERNPSHTYTTDTSENYTVSVNVTGNYGQTGSMIKSDYITIEIPTIELILSESLPDESLLANDSIPVDQSLPQAQSLSQSTSGFRTQSLLQSSSGYLGESLPKDISPQNGVSAYSGVIVGPSVRDWKLDNGDNTKDTAFWMLAGGNRNWKVEVRDAMDGIKPSGTVGRMAEYNFGGTPSYVSPGKFLQNVLRLQTVSWPRNQLGSVISLPVISGMKETILTGSHMIWIGHINLFQRVEPSDSSLGTDKGYRIVIMFEASSV